jgi:hypothetical protein
VRAFVATFQGLSSTAKQKELLEPFGLQRASLEEAFVRPDGTLDRGRIGRLLEAMQGRTGPVRARRLGELGRAHLASGTPRGVVAHRRIEIDDPRSPVLVEAALILLDEDGERSVTVGINNSPALAGGDAIPGCGTRSARRRSSPRTRSGSSCTSPGRASATPTAASRGWC